MKGLHEAQINLSVLAVPKMERDRKYSDVLQRRSHAIRSAIEEISHQGSCVGELLSPATTVSEAFSA